MSLATYFPGFLSLSRPLSERDRGLSLQGSGKKKDPGKKVVSLVIVVRSLTVVSSVS